LCKSPEADSEKQQMHHLTSSLPRVFFYNHACTCTETRLKGKKANRRMEEGRFGKKDEEKQLCG
jgi:hypothetical protein